MATVQSEKMHPHPQGGEANNGIPHESDHSSDDTRSESPIPITVIACSTREPPR